MQFYCPQCSRQLAADAIRCGGCPAKFTDLDGWQPTTVPGKVRKPRTTLSAVGLSVCVGLTTSLIFFLGCIFMVIFVGGVMGSAPPAAHVMEFLINIPLKLLNLRPSLGLLLLVSCFWGGVATFVTLAACVFSRLQEAS